MRNPDARTLLEIPHLLKENPKIPALTIVSDDVEDMWIRFCMGYDEVLSAGCLVTNDEGDQLWIERNGKWDLPKGKVEQGESLEDAAVREVAEETGISSVIITSELQQTYHTYEENGRAKLKTTFWFNALHDGGATRGLPQAEEGITDVQWLRVPIASAILNRTYSSIRGLVELAKEQA